jgi:hypothetical protein
VIFPVVGSSSFNKSFIKVDFPEPLLPTINTNSPLSIVRLIPFIAGVPVD